MCVKLDLRIKGYVTLIIRIPGWQISTAYRCYISKTIISMHLFVYLLRSWYADMQLALKVICLASLIPERIISNFLFILLLIFFFQKLICISLFQKRQGFGVISKLKWAHVYITLHFPFCISGIKSKLRSYNSSTFCVVSKCNSNTKTDNDVVIKDCYLPRLSKKKIHNFKKSLMLTFQNPHSN